MTGAWTGTGLILLPFVILIAFQNPGRDFARATILAAALALAVAAVAGLGLAVTARPRTNAWLCVTGAVGALAAMGYLRWVSDEPTAIPIGGFAGLLVSLCLLIAASSTLPRG
jgi:hypothetical protein